ncbi:unnamed protein product [Fasciola hepatica]|uniref:Uncharacterized protein n=2 Tax=Fasciola hepatica TaxID=6192 RepID=A0ABC9HFY7_FASHE
MCSFRFLIDPLRHPSKAKNTEITVNNSVSQSPRSPRLPSTNLGNMKIMRTLIASLLLIVCLRGMSSQDLNNSSDQTTTETAASVSSTQSSVQSTQEAAQSTTAQSTQMSSSSSMASQSSGSTAAPPATGSTAAPTQMSTRSGSGRPLIQAIGWTLLLTTGAALF